jgi:ectoine hydroxylase-related dioxygenase (phytanoyl-CoA dioxygenase family)
LDQKAKSICRSTPIEVLNQNFTIRIHLDDTKKDNGALKVIPQSHRNGVVRLDNIDNFEQEVICDVEAGGIMLMKPLLFYASNKTINNERRRVIHIEFSY